MQDHSEIRLDTFGFNNTFLLLISPSSLSYGLGFIASFGRHTSPQQFLDHNPFSPFGQLFNTDFGICFHLFVASVRSIMVYVLLSD